jgi:hypothetical protein
MTERRPIPPEGMDPEAIQELFRMQPLDTNLTPGQIVRRALIPRWEVIIPAEHDPVQAEDRMIENILSELPSEPTKHKQNPGAH